MKIRTQFTWMVVSIVSIPILLGGALLGSLSFLSRIDASIPSFSQLPAEYRALTMPSDWQVAQVALEVRPRASSVQIFRRDGDQFRVLYSSETRVPAGTLWTETSLQPLFRENAEHRNFIFGRLEQTSLYALITLERTQSPPNPEIYLLIFVGAIVVGLLLSSLVWAIIMVNGSARALVKLNLEVRRVGRGDFDHAVGPIKGNDEIAELCTTVDRLRLDLKEAYDQQQRFVMGISHDLRSPLSLVKGYVEALRDWPESDQQSTEHYFGLILHKVDTLDSMIDQLIDHGRFASGEWSRHQNRIKIVPFLETLVSIMALDAREIEREVSFRTSVEFETSVLCDDRSVRRAIENLILNALRYTPSGGKILVSLDRDDEAWVLEVRDNGPGIAEADLPFVFEPFYRGSPSRQEPGLGLGLAIAKNIVDTHGWSLHVHNDQGAVFRIRIPLTTRSQ